MTAVALPSLPAPWMAVPRLLDFGVIAQPPLGGVEQRISRLGSRWAVDFTDLPSMNSVYGQALMAARFKARASGSTVSCAWPQPAFATAIGTPLVDGAAQAGTTLNIKGLTPGTTGIKSGLFFSLSVSSRNYLYCVTADATADGAGKAALSIAPMLRASPADAAAISFAAPTIEGFIQGQVEQWQLAMRTSLAIAPFTIQEVQ